MIKVLIIGLGSIGQRHAKALIALGVENIAALRTGKGQKNIDEVFSRKIKMFKSEEEAIAWKPTHMVVSNPTSLHLKYINIAIENNINFFVEKPISDNLEDINSNIDISVISGVVGYNLRFHKMFQFIKDKINSGEFGKIYTAIIHVGQYLPNWHPYEDYREAYYSRRELGGGALRTLSHEIDLTQFLFGKVKSVFAKVQKLSDLEINVDDVTNILAETEYCEQVNININFLDPEIDRSGILYFAEGILKYDFIKSIITFTSNDKKGTIIYNDIENINNQYESQMAEFIKKSNTNYACTFNDGIEVLKIIDKCIMSNKEKREICLV